MAGRAVATATRVLSWLRGRESREGDLTSMTVAAESSIFTCVYIGKR
jgi:hypothetical protein